MHSPMVKFRRESSRQHFGNRNHSTAVAAEKKVRRWLSEDEQLQLGDSRVRIRDLIERIERELQQ